MRITGDVRKYVVERGIGERAVMEAGKQQKAKEFAVGGTEVYLKEWQGEGDISEFMNPEDVDQFLGLPKGSFNHIPNYARHAALHAIANVRKLEEQRLFRPGLYYIVLIDLTSSTEASKALGTELNQKRVQTFVTASVEALGNIELSSYAQFLKEVGDATLFIFSSFEDLHAWWEAAEHLFARYNEEWNDAINNDNLFKAFVLRAKTVVHLGEVSYIAHGNPLSLAVNQVFKIEKLFKPSQLGCTEAVRSAASPHFEKLKIRPTRGKSVILPGEVEEYPTWVLENRTVEQARR